MDLLLGHLGKGLFYIILISMPIVLVAALIGLIVGILQAVTQVQEQTIAAAPKILGVFLTIIIGGTIIIRILNNYLHDSIELAVGVIPKNANYAVEPGDIEYLKSKRRVYDFFNDKKFIRKKEHPSFKEMVDKPADSPYLKTNEPKSPTVYSPAPPIPDASITEEIQNYKNMQNNPKSLREQPSKLQKTPVIPPASTTKTNPTISILPNLDEPPSVDIKDVKPSIAIASGKIDPASSVTGAAAYLTPGGVHKFDSSVKGSTIIISDNSNSQVYTDRNSNQVNTNNVSKGAIILESE